jgi:hypothetical protein
MYTQLQFLNVLMVSLHFIRIENIFYFINIYINFVDIGLNPSESYQLLTLEI